MKTEKTVMLLAAFLACFAAVSAEQEKSGIKIGQRLTLHPYVSLSYTYDSNVDSAKHSKSGSSWTITPGVNGNYADEQWEISGSVNYSYHAYNRYSKNLNSSSLREEISIGWKNSEANERGWSAKVGQHFSMISQDDDMSNSNGRGIGRDRDEWGVDGLIERRVNQHLHASVNASYYYLKYDNDVDKYAPMYGWKRANGGAQVGWAFGSYSDLFLNANYHQDWQDNKKDRSASRRKIAAKDRNVSSESKGYNLHVGIGSRATTKIGYRISGGWSHYEYGGGVHKSNNFTYQASGHWRVDPTLAIIALGSSYYQPSERDYGSSLMTYNFGLGIAKNLIKGNKLTLSFDGSYRYETHDYVQYAADDYDTHIMTFRGRVSYRVNRWLSAFAGVEYQTEIADGGAATGHYYDYDRVRGTFGMQLNY